MTDRINFDMYSNYDSKIPIRKKDLRSNKEEFGWENKFKKENTTNKESFSDWLDKIAKDLEN